MQINNFFRCFLPLIFLAKFSFAQNATLIESKPDATRGYNVATVQALNKTTARTSVLEMKLGEKISFGQLRIIARRCWQAPLDQKPESKILLEVFENKNDEKGEVKETRIFYGWMFASSPSISGLEHPIYDVIALGCKSK